MHSLAQTELMENFCTKRRQDLLVIILYREWLMMRLMMMMTDDTVLIPVMMDAGPVQSPLGREKQE